MNIIFLTSSMTESDFSSYQSKAKIKPNPSNQNFYNKLIKCLSLKNDVYPLSLRPFCKGMFDEEELPESRSDDGSITYYYPKVSSSRRYKVFNLKNEIIKVVDKIISEEDILSYVIIVDTLRYPLLCAAKELRRRDNAKIIGVVTDNPSNLSNVSKRYIKSIYNASSDLDGYICLTEKLNVIFNKSQKPNYILEGLAEEIEPAKKLPIGDYIFFGGALYERYGVKNLINAFHKIDAKVNLVIAGSGELKKYIYDMSNKDKRILYLSQVDKKMIYNLEQNALLNINPRPYDLTLDSESVPSKLIEYLSSGAPTMSTIHSTIKTLFSDNVIWVENSSEQGLQNALEDYFSKKDHKEDIKKASAARLRIYDLYGFNNQSVSLSSFLESIKTD